MHMKQHSALFITLLATVTLSFLGLLATIFYPLFWAVVFAIVCMPLYRYILKYMHSETVSTLITLLLVVLFVVVPIGIVGTALAQEARTVYEALNGQASTQGYALFDAAQAWIQKLTLVGIDTSSLQTSIESVAKNASSIIASNAVSFGRATASTILSTFIMIYVLFYLLRDGERIGSSIKKAFPLSDTDEQFLFNRFAEMTRAMFKGTLIVALVQGMLGGALFVLAGISSPLLWALVMALFAVIPGVGPALVWVPVGLLLLVSGSIVPALIVLIGGATLISYTDNVLRPILIGRDTNMPDVLIFVSVLAGLSVFGITGLVIGPALAALTVAFWELYARA